MVHALALLIVAPFCIVTAETAPGGNTPCVTAVAPALFRIMLSSTNGVVLLKFSAPVTVTTGATPTAQIIDPPVSVVEPDKVSAVPVERLNVPDEVLVPPSVSVPTVALTVPLLVRLTFTLPAVPSPPQFTEVLPVASVPVLLKLTAAVPKPALISALLNVHVPAFAMLDPFASAIATAVPAE